jgi:hypothetical protein
LLYADLCAAFIVAAITAARKGAVSQNGTAAPNSFSRMPGSWSGIADPTGYEVGRKNPVSKIAVHPRSEV